MTGGIIAALTSLVAMESARAFAESFISISVWLAAMGLIATTLESVTFTPIRQFVQRNHIPWRY
jgi:hypothetical protein